MKIESVKELRDILSKLPDEAEIYVSADHGQMPESAHEVKFSHYLPTPGVNYYYGEDIPWDDVTAGMESVTAILIEA